MTSYDQEGLSSPPHRSRCTSHVISRFFSRFFRAFFCAVLGDSQPTPAVIPSPAKKCDEGAAQIEQDNLREVAPGDHDNGDDNDKGNEEEEELFRLPQATQAGGDAQPDGVPRLPTGNRT